MISEEGIISLLLGLGALVLSIYNFVKSRPQRALASVELRKEDAKLRLTLAEEMLRDRKKWLLEPRAKSEFPDLWGLTMARLARYFVSAARSYPPMLAVSELFDMMNEPGFFQDETKIDSAIQKIDRLIATI